MKSTEMYDVIVQGRVRSSSISSLSQCMPSRFAPLKDASLSPASQTSRDSCRLLLSEITGAGPHQATESRITKTRQLSTDSGVESNHPMDTECNRFIQDDTVSDGPYQSTVSSSSGIPEMCYSSSGSQLNSDVFKSSTERNGNYVKPEMFNEIDAAFASCAIRPVSSYVRPETLEWDNKPYHHHCVSESADSGFTNKAVYSSELITGSHDTEQELQFNNDGYVTSPV